MGKKRKELSHEEIWDDSALVESWNAAYEEYKHYHSLHARGEKVQDVLDSYEREEAQLRDGDPSPTDMNKGSTGRHPSSEDGEIEDGADHSKPGPDHGIPSKQVATATATAKEEDLQHHSGGTSHAITDDSQLLGVVEKSTDQNSTVKNLMMSWYWAGYYTGLHEGQRRAVRTDSAMENTN